MKKLRKIFNYFESKKKLLKRIEYLENKILMERANTLHFAFLIEEYEKIWKDKNNEKLYNDKRVC